MPKTSVSIAYFNLGLWRAVFIHLVNLWMISIPIITHYKPANVCILYCQFVTFYREGGLSSLGQMALAWISPSETEHL